jgi:hypothetical protein
MCKKLLILSLCISVLFVFSAPISSVMAGGKKNKINWRIAGTIVQFIDINVLQVPPLPALPFFESVGMHSLINLSAQGSPGPAKITLLSQTGEPDRTDCISSDYVPVASFIKNDFIALFPDQSLLFASIDDSGGILCMGIAGTAVGTTYFKVKMNITGGTGRFEGVTGGEFEAEGYGYPGFSSDTTLVGENGTITGTIKFSD